MICEQQTFRERNNLYIHIFYCFFLSQNRGTRIPPIHQHFLVVPFPIMDICLQQSVWSAE